MRTSDDLDKIAAAMAEALPKLSNPPKTKKVLAGPYSYYYAELPDILDHARPILAEHGLVLIQAPLSDGTSVGCTTRLMHSSGQWIEDEVMIPCGERTAQGFGKVITYSRRYAVSAMLGIAAEDDDDAQGDAGTKPAPSYEREHRSEPERTAATFQKPRPPERSETGESITEAQLKMLHRCFGAVELSEGDRRGLVENMTGRHVESTKDLTKREASKIIDAVKGVEDGSKEWIVDVNGLMGARDVGSSKAPPTPYSPHEEPF